MTSEPILSRRSERFIAFWRNKVRRGGGGEDAEGLRAPLRSRRRLLAQEDDRVTSAVMVSDLRSPLLDVGLRQWLIAARRFETP
jgi:hypothetical protein